MERNRAATAQHTLSQPPYVQGGMTLMKAHEQDDHQVPIPTDGPQTYGTIIQQPQGKISRGLHFRLTIMRSQMIIRPHHGQNEHDRQN